jgi:phosphatidylethanolamine-binding protein (PEBP) family uncharacterized protein
MMTNILKRTNTKQNRTTNTKKQNSSIEVLKVSYPETLLQSIKNNQDIKHFPTIYQNAPQVTIVNAKPKLYLITMTDPDAPYGMTNTNTNNTKSNSKNHTYTHWIYLQDMRKKTNTKNTNKATNKGTNKATILFPYAPPSPPYGIHRYQFKLYDITTLSLTTLDTLKKNINNSLDRNIDYISSINLIPIVQFQYRVNSGKASII